MIRLVLSLGMGLLANSALAVWSSGGGHLLTVQTNPWFVQNTKSVHYCINMDKKHFGVDEATADAAFQKAISYWQNDFKLAPKADGFPNQEGAHPFVIGTQEFIKAPCSADVDLTLQLGTLSAEQETYLKNPKRIVSDTIVTSYDTKALKAKGYIYVSPESGRLKLSFDYLQIDRWSEKSGRRLEMVFIHELGHLFGIAHAEDYNSIMWRHFPMYLASYLFEENPFTIQIPSYFLRELDPSQANLTTLKFPLEWDFSKDLTPTPSEILTELFGSDFLIKYIMIKIDNAQISIHGAESWQGPYAVLADKSKYITGYESDVSFIGDFFLPLEQTVFDAKGDFEGLYLRPTEVSNRFDFEKVNDRNVKISTRFEISKHGLRIRFPNLSIETSLFQNPDGEEESRKFESLGMNSIVKKMMGQQ